MRTPAHQECEIVRQGLKLRSGKRHTPLLTRLAETFLVV